MCSSIAALHRARPREALPAANATIQSNQQQADVAQLVEQLIRNQQVVSSSLTVGSSKIKRSDA
jgi:hypothetical protein